MSKLITLQSYGSFKRTGNFLEKMLKWDIRTILHDYGLRGVANLRAMTPKDTGKTANMWRYDVSITKTGASINWYNDNVNDGVPIALVIEYGHGTGWGSYVPPHPYINQALEPIYEDLANTVWSEVENG